MLKLMMHPTDRLKIRQPIVPWVSVDVVDHLSWPGLPFCLASAAQWLTIKHLLPDLLPCPVVTSACRRSALLIVTPALLLPMLITIAFSGQLLAARLAAWSLWLWRHGVWYPVSHPRKSESPTAATTEGLSMRLRWSKEVVTGYVPLSSDTTTSMTETYLINPQQRKNKIHIMWISCGYTIPAIICVNSLPKPTK